jgi:hypothetical protein
LLAREITAKELVIGRRQGPETVRVQLIENEALKPATLAPGLSSPGPAKTFRPTGTTVPSRRGLLPPRAVARPTPPPDEEEAIEEPVDEEVQPPEDGVEQEEPPDEEAPAGEGNGNEE